MLVYIYIHIPIKITNNDIINLSELLYYIIKVKEQKLDCIYYNNLIVIIYK